MSRSNVGYTLERVKFSNLKKSCSGLLKNFEFWRIYRGVQLIRTMEISKKTYELANSYELAAPCMSNFLTKLWIFHPEFQIISENKDFTKLMSTF